MEATSRLHYQQEDSTHVWNWCAAVDLLLWPTEVWPIPPVQASCSGSLHSVNQVLDPDTPSSHQTVLLAPRFGLPFAKYRTLTIPKSCGLHRWCKRWRWLYIDWGQGAAAWWRWVEESGRREHVVAWEKNVSSDGWRWETRGCTATATAQFGFPHLHLLPCGAHH